MLHSGDYSVVLQGPAVLNLLSTGPGLSFRYGDYVGCILRAPKNVVRTIRMIYLCQNYLGQVMNSDCVCVTLSFGVPGYVFQLPVIDD